MPRKAVSKKQFRFFKSVESGDTKAKGLSRKEAKEMTEGQSPRGLPERAKKMAPPPLHDAAGDGSLGAGRPPRKKKGK